MTNKSIFSICRIEKGGAVKSLVLGWSVMGLCIISVLSRIFGMQHSAGELESKLYGYSVFVRLKSSGLVLV